MDIKSCCFDNAEKTDLPILTKMAREIIEYNYGQFLDKTLIEDYIQSGESDKEIIDNVNTCLIMKLKNQYIGFSITLSNKIHLLMIDKNMQNKGYGNILLRYIEEKLFKNYDTIELQSFTQNITANRFYKNNGWEIIEKINMNGLEFYKFQKNSV